MKIQFVAILAATTLTFNIAPATAKESSNNQLLIVVQESATLKGKCSNIRITYKIQPLYRQTPGWIRFNLQPTPQFDEQVSHSYEFLNYNIDMNTGKWLFSNVDFFGNVSMEYCKSDGLAYGESKRTGVTKSGRYYLTAYPVFVTNPNSVKGDSSFLSVPIEISVIDSITCQKGNQRKKVTGSNPKCPRGFKKVKKQTSSATNSSSPILSATPTRTYVIPKDYKGEACFPYKTRTYFIYKDGEERFTQIIRVPETPYDYRAARRMKGIEFSVSVGSELSPPSECTEWVWPKKVTLQYPTEAPDPPHEWWGERYSDGYKSIMASKPVFGSELYFIESATPEVCEVVSPKSMPLSPSDGRYASVTVIGKQAGYCKLIVKLKESNWYRSSENYVYYVLIN